MEPQPYPTPEQFNRAHDWNMRPADLAKQEAPRKAAQWTPSMSSLLSFHPNR
jgi:hypothetical protein